MAEKALLAYEWPGSYFVGEEEAELVNRVLHSRSPFRFYGHNLQHFVDQLEAAYCKRLGREYALAVNSGTAALSIAISAMDIGPGDEVLLPAYLWVSCISAVVRAGAIPRLVEIDDTFFMDPLDLERKITPRSKALLCVNMSGSTGRIDDVMRVARAHDLLVLEDNAQANGGQYKGKPLGSFGDIAIFSFQLNKNITAGEGGMLVTDDKRLYERAVALHDLGYPRNEQGRLDTSNPDTQLWGQGSRMGELPAAMLVAQERKLDIIAASMREMNHYLYNGLKGIAGAQPRRVLDPQGDSGSFVLLMWPDEQTCHRIVAATRERGVRPGPAGMNNVPMTDWGMHLYYNNISLVEKRGTNSAGRPWTDPLNDFARSYSYEKGTLPQSDDLFSRTSLIGVPPVLQRETADEIIDIFKQSAAELGY